MLRRTRRAPIACSWCHHRKVRCDASILGSPCTRCRQDGRIDCVLRTKLPKPRRIGVIENLTPAWSPTSEKKPSRRSREIDSPSCVSFDEPLPSHFPNDFLFDLCAESNLRENDLHDLESEYPFLQASSSISLSREDIGFLCSKGAYSLPPRSLSESFVYQYFERVHPIAPVVDEALFWQIWDRKTHEKLSLFLFQALLFASCPFVPEEILHKCGYSNKRDARKHLYNRAKLLFDLNAEARSSVKAQGAILLTHHTSAEAPQAGSLWLTHAIENAVMIDSQPSLLVENLTQSMKKRIWWSILLRDRSICIGLRRRPQITSINIYGFRDWLSEDDFQEEMQCSRVHNYNTKKQVFTALQEQCGLAALLTDLVSLVFNPAGGARRAMTATDFYSQMQSIENIKNSLIEWEFKTRSSPEPAKQICDNPAETLRSLTFMYYHAARIDLAQYTTLLIEEQISFAAHSYKESLNNIASDLETAISGLTSVMEYFSLSGNVEHLPLSVLAYAAMPLVVAAIDLKLSPSHIESEKRQRKLDFISRIIRHSESLFDVTDAVAIGTNQILQLAYIITRKIFLPLTRSRVPRIANPEIQDELVVQKQRKSTSSTWKNNWVAAFISCPRAYLLISTSVDYSLATGHLPCNESIPQLVRQLPLEREIIWLPWAPKKTADEQLGWIKYRYSSAASSGCVESVCPIVAIQDGNGAQDSFTPTDGTEGQVEELPNMDSSSVGFEFSSSINLDYLDFDHGIGMQRVSPYATTPMGFPG